MTSANKQDDKPVGNDQIRDSTRREQQTSHGAQQNRGKKDGHATQIGSGHDQQSSRPAGQEPTHKK